MSELAEARTERVDLRMAPTTKRKLQQAAAITGKTVSEFLLESSLSAANETLTDRRIFQLNDEQWAAFQNALTTPPAENPGLKKLLAHKPAWD